MNKLQPFRSLQRPVTLKARRTQCPNHHLGASLSKISQSSRGYASEPGTPQSDFDGSKFRRRLARLQQRNQQDPTVPKTGGLAKTSIFNDPDVEAMIKLSQSPDSPVRQMVLDPVPSLRQRWERKMIVKDIRNRGRITKQLQLQRTERELTLRSEHWKTSVKKLTMLARQIAGKTLEDAITQMRFSKKKYAAHIRQHLLRARDQAVVERGMGLGDETSSKGEWIQLKDGSSHHVPDKTTIYIDQAWVNRGWFGRHTVPRARGMTHIIRMPTTSLTVLLKEEKTRVRQHEERKEKLFRKKAWVQLPDRSIPAQRPYYAW